MTTADLINQLCLPQSYPHPVDVITTIETHISVVFLTGPYAYKLKKPVNFGFLDFSDLIKRKKFCDLELKLNRRYAPKLYIDVTPIYLKADGDITLYAEKSIGNVVDYLVKMNQFDPNQVLGRRLQNESLDATQVESLAAQIANFHQSAKIVDQSAELGEPETVLQPMLDNFPTLSHQFGKNNTSYSQQLDALHQWTLAQFKILKPLLAQRKKSGFIKACHGDLHIDNITLINNQPMMFDGIEFNENFRWIDVISDLAFLLIDLDFRQQRQLNRSVLSLYLSQTDDYNSLKLLRFYQVYRTLVRAKITTLRAEQLVENSIEREQLLQVALQYMHLASRYTETSKSPKLILLQGVSGSGKSHFANQLLTHLDAIIISSDRVRKQLYGITPLHRVSDAEKLILYSPQMNKKVYAKLLSEADKMLQLGFNVIVDATFLQCKHRNKFHRLCESGSIEQGRSDLNASSHVIYIETPTELAELSIKQRMQKDNNPSDADTSIMLKQLTNLEVPTPLEHALTINSQLLRGFYPQEIIQEFLDLPIQEVKE
ncbi:MAG: hypothetical protein ISEC1_P1250 [Thiomicrorhabdus sp.]|nr:MAG: hypothetical protein ISEC1_P1250 [Thiomicrorhabdus sp.]